MIGWLKLSRALLIALAIAIAIPSGVAFGQMKKKRAKKGRARVKTVEVVNYGMAGCGIGTQIFKQDTTGSQIGVTFFQQWLPATVVYVGVSSAVLGILGSNDGLVFLGVAAYIGGGAASIAFLPSWAMTSGTWNCIPNDSAKVAVMEQRLYLMANHGQIARDAARGEGDHLRALATLFGCDHPVAAALFAKTVHDQYDQIFKVELDAEKSGDTLLKTVRSDTYLYEQCDRII